MEYSWRPVLVRGFILTILLILAHLPGLFLVAMASPRLVVSIAVTIPYAFIDGFLAKYVASAWESEEEENGSLVK